MMPNTHARKDPKPLKVEMLNQRTGETVTMVYGSQGWAVLDVQKVRR